MKILFAIQGTGNGHVSRAIDIYPELAKYGTVDVLISGIQADIPFPFPVKYRCYGLGFIFGREGGVDVLKTMKTARLRELRRDIKRLPVEAYDLVVNDFEPISSWACKWKKRPCVGLSHQSAVLCKDAPVPAKKDILGKLVLRGYAPVTDYYGFHFKSFDNNIYTPVIRRAVRDMVPTDEGHYTVYLPSYCDEALIRHLSHFQHVKWHVFSKHNKLPMVVRNIQLQPVEHTAFAKSMAGSTGVLCGAGFEGPAEALFLGKKLLVIPMVNQYEQHCNAAALKSMGIPVIDMLARKNYRIIEKWLAVPDAVQVHFPDRTAEIIARLVQEHAKPPLPQEQISVTV